MSSIAIIIPARLASTRLPNKLLLDQTGKPLLAHVIEQVRNVEREKPGLVSRIVVAADDHQLKHVAESINCDVVMTRVDHPNGTSRLAEAVQHLAKQELRPDIVINVQGDEPELAPQAIVRVVEALLGNPQAAMSTLIVPMDRSTAELKQRDSAVKCVIDQHGRALYFSRSPIPFDRTAPAVDEPLWYLHLGIYAYWTDFLLKYAELPETPLQRRESLEQLRAIEHGHIIQTAQVPWEWAGKGIDTPEDYADFVKRHQSRR